jgi:hypothetical protein
MKNQHILDTIFEKPFNEPKTDGAMIINQAVCNLKNPVDAVLSNNRGSELKLVSTDLRGDYIGHYLRVAVRQRYLNDTDKTQKIRYQFPLSVNDSLLDFQAVTGNKITRYSDLKIRDTAGKGPYSTALGYLRPGDEISVIYVYARLTQPDEDKRVTIQVMASQKDPNFESMETVGFFLRGNASMATVNSPSTPIFVDRINQGNTYACPNDDTVLNAILAKYTDLNKERLCNGEMDYEELFDLCPAKINPIFDRDFVLTLDDFEVDTYEFTRLPFDVRGEVIDAALSGEEDYSKEFIRAHFLNAPVSPLLPLVEAEPFIKKTSAKEKLFNMTEGETTELLELFETTALTNLDSGGLSGALTLKDILFILLPIVPTKFRILLWSMSFDPMYMTQTEMHLWALLFAKLIESEERNTYAYKNLLRLAKDTIRQVPKGTRFKLMEQLSLTYENDVPPKTYMNSSRSLC